MSTPTSTSTNSNSSNSAAVTTFSFFAPGLPKGQPRVRAYRRGSITGVYDPGTADEWKACVMVAVRAALRPLPATRPLLCGPIRADLTYVFARPKSHFQAVRGRKRHNASACTGIGTGTSLSPALPQLNADTDADTSATPDSQASLKPHAPHHHTSKPDRDNLDKAVLDTLTLAQVWKDDAQVAAGATLKRYAAPGEPTGCHITLTALPQG